MSVVPDFSPTWSSPPGDTILDILADRGMSRRDFVKLMSSDAEHGDGILDGSTPITLKTARILEQSLGGSVAFWMSRDANYRESARRQLNENGDWLQQLPLRDMRKFGWIPKAAQPERELAASLKFFDVSTVDKWRELYADVHELAAFKTSTTLDAKPGAVAAWLRQGEREAKKINVKAWSPQQLREAIPALRKLTRQKDPSVFLPELQSICANAGVAVVLVRAPSGCRASGAARMLPGNKPLILLSYRHRTFDHFWFAFFHEVGHLLLHSSTRLFVDGIAEESGACEDEANAFAAETLVPPEFREALRTTPKTAHAITRLARKAGTSPGIVVGQMEHAGLVAFGRLHRLKREFSREFENG